MKLFGCPVQRMVGAAMIKAVWSGRGVLHFFDRSQQEDADASTHGDYGDDGMDGLVSFWTLELFRGDADWGS